MDDSRVLCVHDRLQLKDRILITLEDEALHPHVVHQFQRVLRQYLELMVPIEYREHLIFQFLELRNCIGLL